MKVLELYQRLIADFVFWTKSLSKRQRSVLYLILILLLPISHFLLPIWILLLSSPYLITWYVYYRYSDKRSQVLGLRLPPLVSSERVYQVTQVFCQQIAFMISAPIRSIGYEHLKRLWLRRQPKRVVKDIDFGSENPKVLLDIYPTKVSRMDHVSYRSDRPNRRPVILFFYGGGWRSGSKNMYEPLGYTLSELGYVVVIPDYGKFPQANAEMMVQDVQLAMAWTLRNIKLYGGDPDNIVVLGHSAGAHLTTLAVLWHAHDQCLGRPNFLQLERLYGLVLVASPFDLNDHFEHEASRGVEQLGCMERLFGKDYDRYSPTRILNGLDKRWVNSNVFNQHCPQNWLLLHTLTDIVVPFSSSFKFCSALQQNHFDGVALKHYRSPGHADLIVDLMLPATLERSKFEDDMGEFYVHAERLTRYHNYVREQSSQNLAYVSYAQFTLQDVKGPSPAR